MKLKEKPLSLISLLVGTLFLLSSSLRAEDWPMWGRTPGRNMSAAGGEVRHDFSAGKLLRGTDRVDAETLKHVLWVEKLGSQSYGNPTVAGGRVYVGTNNESPRDKRVVGDRGILLCLDAKDGKLQWQLVIPKLGAGKVSDWDYLGLCSSPAVEGEFVYVITNRCEVLCLDVKGQSDGNAGPYMDEMTFSEMKELLPTDADIVWRFDMREELGVFPHNITSSSVLIVGDVVYANTSNGQDWSHVNIPNPRAPCLIALNKRTGALIGEEGSDISRRLIHGNWSSPSFGEAGGNALLFFGAGDGWVYGYDPLPRVEADGFAVFRELFRADANDPETRVKDGQPRKYPSYDGYSEIIATPVFEGGRLYVSTGQDPEHGQGVGRLTCFDPSMRGDISKSGVIWKYNAIKRSISTPAIGGGLVFAQDYSGVVHCLEADTGKALWTHDTDAHIWSSPLLVGSKLLVGNEDGVLTVLSASREKKVLAEIEFPSALHATPIVAGGVLYVACSTHIYAIAPLD